MAGIGRNYPVLKRTFKNVEMLDASIEMNKLNKHPVIKHECYLENFTWPNEFYNGIVGVACLCYLQGKQLDEALAKMEASLAYYGFMVFLEPVDESLGSRE